MPEDSMPIILKDVRCCKIISRDMKIDEKAATKKKYLNFKTLRLVNKYTITSMKKNLKKRRDFIKRARFSYS